MSQRQPLFALRIDVGIGLVVGWNALCLWGIRLNGGMGRIHNRGSVALMALACGLLSSFFLVAVASSAFRKLVTAESRRHLYTASAWGTIATIPGLMCLLSVAALLGWLPLAGLER